MYAKLLTGDRVFEKVHPLLTASRDDKDSYVSLTSAFGSESLRVPQAQTPTESPDAIFLVEAVSDLESSEGRKFAVDFIATMESMPQSLGENGGVSLAYRILPSTASSASSPLCSVLASASNFSAESLIEALTGESAKNLKNGDNSACSSLPYLENDLPSTPFIVANGRVFSPEDGTVKKEDVELLIKLESGTAKGITKLLMSDLSFEDNKQYDAVAQASSFLAEQQSGSDGKRTDMESMVINMEGAMGIEDNPLRFSWNDANEDDETLKVRTSL